MRKRQAPNPMGEDGVGGAGVGAGGRASSVSSRRSWAAIMQRFLKRVKEAVAGLRRIPTLHPRCASAESLGEEPAPL